MMVDGQNPYRGPFSYKENDEEIFFGRSTEVEELIEFIRKNQLTVLYGASGTGKTSLINAKLLPRLKREYFHPIYIRINFANKDEDPLKFIQKRIVEELRIWDNNIPDFQDDQSLIQYAAKNVIFKGLIKPVLFFDQFEELFTLGPKADPFRIHRFMFQLSELIELRLPDELKTLDYINNISSFKVVFSLRQDWIGFLDDFSQLIPSISEVRYRLKKFSPTQAMEAIMRPSQDYISKRSAEIIISNIGTPALWREDVLFHTDIDKDLINKEVDPFVLSLYCYQLFDKCKNAGHVQITVAFILENKDSKLIRNYYEEKIAEHREIRFLIEDKLLNEAGKRLIIPLSKFTTGKVHIEELTYQVARSTGVVRIIGEGNESEIEIVHDRLAHRIFESKNERIANEIHEEANKKERQAESLKQSATKAKKTVFRISIAAAIVITILIALSLYLYIYSVNNNTIGGLQAQLSSAKKENTIAQNSILTLTDSIQDIKSRFSEINLSALDSNVQAYKLKNDLLIKEQTDSIKDLKQQFASLKIMSQDKDDEIKTLYSNIVRLQESINVPVSQPSTGSDNSKPLLRLFQKSDLSNLNLENLKNQNGYDLADVKKRGFVFTFNLANISSEEKGMIEIRITTKVKRLKSPNENRIQPIKVLLGQAQPIQFVVKAPEGILPGESSYEVRYYFTKREDSNSSYTIEKRKLTISRPPTPPIDQ